MESKWQDGSLTYPVERSLVLLARHLESSNYDEADKLQVDYEFNVMLTVCSKGKQILGGIFEKLLRG